MEIAFIAIVAASIATLLTLPYAWEQPRFRKWASRLGAVLHDFIASQIKRQEERKKKKSLKQEELTLWIRARMKQIGYGDSAPPEHLARALASGKEKDLPAFVYQEWSAYKKGLAPYSEEPKEGETDQERRARIQRNIDRANKWVEENAWNYQGASQETIYTGPRGGRYRINSNGRKSYDVF